MERQPFCSLQIKVFPVADAAVCRQVWAANVKHKSVWRDEDESILTPYSYLGAE